MFSEAFVGSSSRLTSASSFCTVVCLAFALVVAGPPPPSGRSRSTRRMFRLHRRQRICGCRQAFSAYLKAARGLTP